MYAQIKQFVMANLGGGTINFTLKGFWNEVERRKRIGTLDEREERTELKDNKDVEEMQYEEIHDEEKKDVEEEKYEGTHEEEKEDEV